MTVTDPLADMLTRIVNGQAAGKVEVSVPVSKIKLAVGNVLKEEGYLADLNTTSAGCKSVINLKLKYFNGTPVIRKLQRVSKPGKRVYKPKDELPKVLAGFGISIITTSAGVMTDKKARKLGYGGEVLCRVE